jgi:capsular exopolysaccharide synthesis family protein
VKFDKQDKFKNYKITEKGSTKFDFAALLKTWLFHWPLFAIFLSITFGLAFFYMSNFQPSYTINALLIFKEEKPVQDTRSEMTSETGIDNSSAVLQNEIEILKSKQLLRNVVDTLKLWVNYQKKQGLFFKEIYNQTPVRLEFFKANQIEHTQHLDINIIDNKDFFLNTPDEKQVKLRFDTYYRSNVGIWKLVPANKTGLIPEAEIKIDISNPDQTALEYQKKIEADLSNKLATAVLLTIKDQVPQRGKDILDLLIKDYNQTFFNQKNADAQKALSFLTRNISSMNADITQSDKRVEGIKKQNGLTDVASNAKIQLEDRQNIGRQLDEARLKLINIENIEGFLNANTTQMPSTDGIDDQSLKDAVANLQKLQLQHDEMKAQGTPDKNPMLETNNNSIKSLRDRINGILQSNKNNLLKRIAQLETYNTQSQNSIRNLPSQEREINNQMRDAPSKESIYDFLLQEREKIAVKFASNLTNNHTVDRPYAIMPKDFTMVIYFGALLIGCAIPSVLLLIRRKLHNQILTVHDIADETDLPVIGELPFEKSRTSFILNDQDVSPGGEQIRAIRINLYNYHKQREKGRVTLITSSISGEGKSFVSLNLSIALAFTSRKTIILELDMRKPKIAHALKLKNPGKGISDYLLGRVDVTEIIQPTSIADLFVITSGSKVNHPSDLLERKRLKELISYLQENYDDIMIDSPPIHLVADAAVISRLSHVTLFIIRQGYTKKSELAFINHLAEQQILTNIHLIFNGIERIKYGYGYQFDQNYYNKKSSGAFKYVFGDFKNRF